MGRGQRPHVEDLPVGGLPAVEVFAVEGGDACPVVGGVFRGVKSGAVDPVGIADLVDAAALGDGLTRRNDTGAYRRIRSRCCPRLTAAVGAGASTCEHTKGLAPRHMARPHRNGIRMEHFARSNRARDLFGASNVRTFAPDR